MKNINQCCFIVPPHIEKRVEHRSRDPMASNASNVSSELRRRRNEIIKLPHIKPRGGIKTSSEVADNQDIFTAQRTYNLPGWKVANVATDAEKYVITKQCWDNTQEILEYYRDIVGFDLVDSLNGQVKSTLEVGEKYNNAFFTGEQMAYGDGDGIHFKEFCWDQTVVCHELGHGVVNGTVPLVYKNHSGALNESYADIFSVCFMHYKAKKSFKDLTKDDWMIGERCVVGQGALRSFTKTPSRSPYHPLGPDTEPRHIKHRYRGSEDNGGVHINSGIINHAFYQVCKSLANYKGGNTWEHPLQLWFSLLKNKTISPKSNFAQFAKALIATSKNILPEEYSNQVVLALKKVGLPCKLGHRRGVWVRRPKDKTVPCDPINLIN
jgi:Zn-dependent metalloprotease